MAKRRLNKKINYDKQIGWHQNYKGFKYVRFKGDGHKIGFKFPGAKQRWYTFSGSTRAFLRFCRGFLHVKKTK